MRTANLFGKILAFISLCVCFACQEEPVGAPCFPESDNGAFKPQKGITDLIETRSVQCETRTCVTRTVDRNPIISKYSFCSCKCKNVEGHEVDKQEDLCECPPNTKCMDVNFPVEDTPEKVLGKYCIPQCIIDGCPGASGFPDGTAECMPSSNSDEPWAWKCRSK